MLFMFEYYLSSNTKYISGDTMGAVQIKAAPWDDINFRF